MVRARCFVNKFSFRLSISLWRTATRRKYTFDALRKTTISNWTISTAADFFFFDSSLFFSVFFFLCCDRFVFMRGVSLWFLISMRYFFFLSISFRCFVCCAIHAKIVSSFIGFWWWTKLKLMCAHVRCIESNFKISKRGYSHFLKRARTQTAFWADKPLFILWSLHKSSNCYAWSEEMMKRRGKKTSKIHQSHSRVMPWVLVYCTTTTTTMTTANAQ